MQWTIVAVCFLASITTVSAAMDGEEPLIVSPIISQASGQIHSGELVWVDLVTTNPRQAMEFYTTVFGWQPHFFDDDNYIELSHDGRVICSIVQYSDEETVAGDAWWLVSISVPSVDDATRIAVTRGGQVLVAPTELPNRGRYSVIKDSQGALLMLLRATGGDPIDAAQYLDEWAWGELWTEDPESAADFYVAMVGYDTLQIPGTKGTERILLGTNGRARATIVKLPWAEVKPNWLPYIPVADLQITMQRILAAGGAVLVQSDGADSSVAVAIVSDPTGGVFAVQQAELAQ
jgi:predicted enzyme related to lactoylglutathione lyase